MKVCFVLNSHYSCPMGGAEYQAMLLLERLAAEGIEVRYLCRHGPELQGVGLVGSRRKLAKYAYFFDAIGLYNELRKYSPDVVYHRNGGAYSAVCAFYCKKFGRRFIWNLAHDNEISIPKLSEIKNPLKYVDKLMLRYALRHRDVLIAQTLEQQKLLADNYSIADSVLIPNYHPVPLKPDFNSKQSRTKRRVSWVANLKPIKQPDHFIELVRSFKNDESIEFVMAGKCESRYSKMIADATSELKNFEYLGSISQGEVGELLRDSDVFVSTSLAEGFPNTFIQAWLNGVPVLSENVNPSEVITRFEIGKVSKNIEDLSCVLRILLSDRQQLKGMAERARAYAENHHSLDNLERVIDLMCNCR